MAEKKGEHSSESREDYLRCIYKAGGCTDYVPNKVLATELGVAVSSITEMLNRLQKEGYLEYKAYHGSKLTEKGKERGASLIREHRLWEVFLMEHLGYTWREAHEDAHKLEHIDSPRLVERLDAYLGHPKHCPHGSPIPGNEDEAESEKGEDLIPLAELKEGEEAMVARIREEGDLLDYLGRIGLKIDRKIKVEKKEEFEGPIHFLQEEKDGKTTLIAIAVKAADGVYVRRNP